MAMRAGGLLTSLGLMDHHGAPSAISYRINPMIVECSIDQQQGWYSGLMGVGESYTMGRPRGDCPSWWRLLSRFMAEEASPDDREVAPEGLERPCKCDATAKVRTTENTTSSIASSHIVHTLCLSIEASIVGLQVKNWSEL